MTGIFKVPALDPDAHNLQDQDGSPDEATQRNGQDRTVEIGVRLDGSSLNGVPSVHQRTGLLKFADFEGLGPQPG
jgi:hypothetical protein